MIVFWLVIVVLMLIGTALFVLVGALVIILRARRRQTGEKFSSQEQQRLAQLLGESDRKES